MFRIYIYRWKHVIILELTTAHLRKLIIKKKILIIGEGPRQGLDDVTLTAKAKHPINFTQPRKRFVLSLDYNGSNSFLFVNATKIYKFKAKDSKIKDDVLCLGNISKDFIINNMKKTGLKGSCMIHHVMYKFHS